VGGECRDVETVRTGHKKMTGGLHRYNTVLTLRGRGDVGAVALALAHQQGHLGNVVADGIAPQAGRGLVGIGLDGGHLELGDHEPVHVLVKGGVSKQLLPLSCQRQRDIYTSLSLSLPSPSFLSHPRPKHLHNGVLPGVVGDLERKGAIATQLDAGGHRPLRLDEDGLHGLRDVRGLPLDHGSGGHEGDGLLGGGKGGEGKGNGETGAAHG